MVAEVVINSTAKELNKTFDYKVPKALISKAKIGARVLVPFRAKKIEEGYIIDLKEKSEYETKEILSVEDNLLNEKNINLAKLMARRYFCNISDCIKLMLPPGNTNKKIENRVKEKTANFVYLKDNVGDLTRPTPKQLRVLEFLQDNDGTYISDLEAITETSRAIIKTLEKNGYVEIVEEQVLRNPFINKKIKKDKPHVLTKEQQHVYDNIADSTHSQFLIFGVTGSRKDRNILAAN